MEYELYNESNNRVIGTGTFKQCIQELANMVGGETPLAEVLKTGFRLRIVK